MFEFLRKGSVQKIETDMARLESRRAQLQAKLSAAGQALEEARKDRTGFLIDTDGDNVAARASLEKTLLSAERDETALQDAIIEIESQIAAASEHLAASKDAEAREKAAAKYEKDATNIEKLALSLEKKISELAVCFDQLVAAIPLGAIAVPRYGQTGNEAAMSPSDLARAVVSEGLYEKCEELFECYGSATIGTTVSIALPVFHRRNDGALSASIPKNDDSVKFLPASGAAEANLVAPLRRAADALRTGKLALGAAFDIVAQRPVVVEPPPFEVSRPIIITKKISFINQNGDRQERVAWTYPGLPRPLAEACFAAGVASR